MSKRPNVTKHTSEQRRRRADIAGAYYQQRRKAREIARRPGHRSEARGAVRTPGVEWQTADLRPHRQGTPQTPGVRGTHGVKRIAAGQDKPSLTPHIVGYRLARQALAGGNAVTDTAVYGASDAGQAVIDGRRAAIAEALLSQRAILYSLLSRGGKTWHVANRLCKHHWLQEGKDKDWIKEQLRDRASLDRLDMIRKIIARLRAIK